MPVYVYDSSDDEEFRPPVNLLSDPNSSDDDEEVDSLYGDGESDDDGLLGGIESQEYLREVAEEEDDDFFLSPYEPLLENDFNLFPPETLLEEDDDFFLEDGEEETEDQLVEYEESEEEIETRRRLLEPREVEFTSPSENRIKIQLEPRDCNGSTCNLVGAESNGSDENVVCCSICMNPYSSEGDGDHQVSCLPCGHLYGLSCIQRWIRHSKQRYSKCPICNQKCALKDVVKLYVSSLPVVDRQENSVSFQPRDDIFKVHFAKYKEELADVKREVKENTKFCERLERISTQDEYVEGMRKAYEEHLNEFEEKCEAYEKHINECKEELADTKREVMKNTICCEANNKKLELLERTFEEVLKERRASSLVDEENKKIQQRTDKTITGLQRKLKRKKNELVAKNRVVEQLTKATEAKDKRIEQLMKRIKRESGKRRKRRELRIQQMFKGGRLMDRALRRSISEAKKAKDRKMEQSMRAIERQDLQIQPMSKRRRLMDPAIRAVL